jgi:2-hydroxy-3-oxopropionate reductase
MPGKLGIIGLGRTGLPAAKTFINAGFQVFGYDIRSAIRTVFEDLGGVFLESPQKIAAMTDTMLVMVLNDVQVKEVISGGQGLLKGTRPGSVIICMSTINRSALEEQARKCREKQIGLVDCPFTGGPARIPGGDLTLIAAEGNW